MTSSGSDAAARLQMAQTRGRLGQHVHEAAALAAPSRLVASGVEAVKAAAASTMANAVQRVTGAAGTTARRPGLVTAIAGGAGSIALALLARRRLRRAPATTKAGRAVALAAAVLRPGSPWLGLALTVATAMLRRRGPSVMRAL